MTLTIPSKNDLLPLPVVPNKRIVIDISSQSMTVYENGAVRNTYVVSTGVADSPTMAGVFQIQTHELNAYASNWDLYMPHFMGIYEAWPGFMNGIHGLPLLSSGVRLWASTLGSPASYGCIILDLAAAEDLYNWAEDGVVVEITQ
jgi:lipoprotein-anchoring transpeptidase ErfK/SrfK